MKSNARIALLAPLIGAIFAVTAPAAQGAVGIEKFVGVNCVATHEDCGEKTVGADVFAEPLEETVEPTLAESETEGYRQAAGHVPYGVTDFMVTHTGEYSKGEAIPTGIVDHVRVDVAAGLATSPAAVPQCTQAEFGETEAIPGTGFYAAPKCKEGTGEHGIGPESTVIGEEKATVYVKALEEETPSLPPDVALKGKLYNLVQPAGRSAEYGAALALPIPLTYGQLNKALKGSDPAVETAQYYAHTIVEGSVEWGKEAKGTEAADYHDYFEVKVSPALPLIRSRQLDYGTAGNGAFITNATKCPGNHTTILSLEGTGGEVVKRPYETLLGLDGCENVPFAPTFALTPQTTQQDESDGITTELTLPSFLKRKSTPRSSTRRASRCPKA